MPLTTTIQKINQANEFNKSRLDCSLEGYFELMEYLKPRYKKTESVSYLDIAKVVSFDSLLKVCRSSEEHSTYWMFFIIWCCKRVKHLMSEESLSAFSLAENYPFVEVHTSDKLWAAHNKIESPEWRDPSHWATEAAVVAIRLVASTAYAYKKVEETGNQYLLSRRTIAEKVAWASWVSAKAIDPSGGPAYKKEREAQKEMFLKIIE